MSDGGKGSKQRPTDKAKFDANYDAIFRKSPKEFDGEFIELARSVYVTNDKRAEIKKEINIKYGSLFVEEKSYKEY